MGLIFFAFFEKFFVPILTSGGYVGLSIATLLSQHHKVTAVDIIPEKVDMINNRKSPIQDDYIEKYLAEKELNLTASGATIYARKKITIGENTCIGGNCKILDNDFHPIEAETRNKLLRDENGGNSDLVPSREGFFVQNAEKNLWYKEEPMALTRSCTSGWKNTVICRSWYGKTLKKANSKR